VNLLVWREQDAVRNSIQMAGQAEFSHNALMHMSCDNIQEMLWNERNINWNNYPTKAKRGTYVQRRKVLRGFSTEELAVLPPKHEAHTNPDLKIERSETIVLDMPIITQVVNICGVVFAGDRPLIE
jgi:hypothetical protein